LAEKPEFGKEPSAVATDSEGAKTRKRSRWIGQLAEKPEFEKGLGEESSAVATDSVGAKTEKNSHWEESFGGKS
jgi:hypothetical protein